LVHFVCVGRAQKESTGRELRERALRERAQGESTERIASMRE